MAKIYQVYFLVKQLDLSGMLNPDEKSRLHKAAKEVDHGLRVKNLKKTEKAINQLARLIVSLL